MQDNELYLGSPYGNPYDDTSLMQTPYPWGIISLILRQIEIHLRTEREKDLRTIWTELAQDYPKVFNLCSAQSQWFAAEKYEMERPLTLAERKTLATGVPLKTIAEARLWNKRSDGITIKMPREGKVGEFNILEFKRMSDVTENTLPGHWAKDKTEGQCVIKDMYEYPPSTPSLDLESPTFCWLVLVYVKELMEVCLLYLQGG